jgi:signal peptidase I
MTMNRRAVESTNDEHEAGVAPKAEPGGTQMPTAAVVPPRHKGLRRVVRIFVVVVAILFVLRLFVIEPFAIPTGSMRPTILQGDVVLVNKLPFVIRSPRTIPFTSISIPYFEWSGIGKLDRGEVVVFSFPSVGDHREGEQFFKRCVALAGDTLTLVQGRVAVNGSEVLPVGPSAASSAHRAAVDENRVWPPLRDDAFAVVPFRGMRVALDSSEAARWRRTIEADGTHMSYENRIIFLDGLPATFYTFRHDFFFALGDNSPDSYDSRFFGPIPTSNLIGRAAMVYWSREPGGSIRWSRIGVSIE